MIYNEKKVGDIREHEVDFLDLTCNEKYEFAKKHWEVEDTLTYPNGKVEKRKYYNTVVDDCSKLIACLMKGQAGCTGIAYWAVGKGDSSWSNENPPNPSISGTKLTFETFRKAIPSQNIVFLDSNNNVTTNFTNKIQISISFNESEANGELREFSLWGGNATSAKDSGIMINHKIHPIIYKTSGMVLNRTIRITF